MRNQRKNKQTAKSVANGLSFACDWSRGWCEFLRPINARSEGKPVQYWMTFDSQF